MFDDYRYDKQTNERVPIIEVEVINPINGQKVEGVKLLIDTGAQASVIPAHVFTKLDIYPHAFVNVKDWKGRISKDAVYWVKLSFENCCCEEPFDVFTTPAEIGLIGDDLHKRLNKKIIFLDYERCKLGVFGHAKDNPDGTITLS